MWNWDQGRLTYFQFDNLRKIARFSLTNDLRLTDHATLSTATGLPFLPNNKEYPPWRNYLRVFRLSMICIESDSASISTPLAALLASDGGITTDEYFHFLSRATTDPSPALTGWNHTANLRYPLLFSLKFLLARAAIGVSDSKILDIIAAYTTSQYTGDEDQSDFVTLIKESHDIPATSLNTAKYRQAAESIRVIAQISYLSLAGGNVTVSLSKEDAFNLFEQLNPIGGDALRSGADEVLRLTNLFESAISEFDLDYATTAVSNLEDSGFLSEIALPEGAKVRKTHLIIERNGKVRAEFFKKNPSSICDFCGADTAILYPWTPRILDVHHLLPLRSGTQTSKKGTLLDDLVAICPTCHRGVHRYYDRWLKEHDKNDFTDIDEANIVYNSAKNKFRED